MSNVFRKAFIGLCAALAVYAFSAGAAFAGDSTSGTTLSAQPRDLGWD
ncbi:hypothetical protein [Streptomyces sp. NPDC058157]